jgi:hypothetical protein
VKEVLQQLVMSSIGGGRVDVEKLIDKGNDENHTITDFLAKQVKKDR